MSKKIVSLVVALLLIIAAAASATFAYFKDIDYVKNEFTVGNVDIDLTEGDWIKDANGNIVPAVTVDGEKKPVEADGTADRLFEGNVYDPDDEKTFVNNYGKLYPGMSIYKDPTIENIGSEDAYVAAKITITDGAGDIWNVLGVDKENQEYDNIDISGIVTGGLASQKVEQGDYNGLTVYENDKYAVYQDPSRADGTYVLYFFIKNPLKGTEETGTGESVVLFEGLVIPAEWEYEQIKEFADLDIVVHSFATQTNGFTDCYDAMTKAFSEEFAF